MTGKVLGDLLCSGNSNKDKTVIKKKYVLFLKEDSAEYTLNLGVSGYNRTYKTVYSIIKNAFNLYKKDTIKYADILVNLPEDEELIRGIKESIENRSGYAGTDAGLYETPFLGKAYNFSVERINVKLRK